MRRSTTVSYTHLDVYKRQDILIGQTPPGMFLDPTNTIIAFWTVNCMFLTIRMKWSQLLHLQGETYDNIMNFLDAVGLGLFTATGVKMCIRDRTIAGKRVRALSGSPFITRTPKPGPMSC